MEKYRKHHLTTEPTIKVGILSGAKIEFILIGDFIFNKNRFSGTHSISIEKEKINWNGKLFDHISFSPTNKEKCFFEIKDVTIGIDFHWQQQENQRFAGSLEIILNRNKLLVINRISVEKYLESVISSEMKATASIPLLKAHTIISRSWIFNKLTRKATSNKTKFISETENIQWWENDDHKWFDVCSDDHCQRYQGVGKVTNATVYKAVKETCGEILMYENRICDTRFSKCCGGKMEEFQYCWANENHPYLVGKTDTDSNIPNLDLRIDENTKNWINQQPDCFCNTNDKNILSKILNDYDLSTPFFRWKVIFTQKELSLLLEKNTGISFGEIIDLQPLERGTSGRISKLEIIGTKHRMRFGKELLIRKILSKSHLYSSAFWVEKSDIKNNIPQKITLYGAGWGHGVGLCQIGAAVMGEKGYDYKEILAHYYPNSEVVNLYHHKKEDNH